MNHAILMNEETQFSFV